MTDFVPPTSITFHYHADPGLNPDIVGIELLAQVIDSLYQFGMSHQQYTAMIDWFVARYKID